jgi:hypothetical protein
MHPYRYCFLLFIFLAATSGCGHKKEPPAHSVVVGETKAPVKEETPATFQVMDFDALTNCEDKTKEGQIFIYLDYFDAVNTGFIVPSVRQKEKGRFICSFKIKNQSGQKSRYSYKIYYQDESYKFPETDSPGGNWNSYSSENFYGSWSDSTVLFRSTREIPSDGQFHEVKDSITIMGNPRNEPMCYYNGVNNRWKRNPRVGTYSFLLAVTTEENIRQELIPAWIQNIGLKKGNDFISPYYYFLYGEGKTISNLRALQSVSRLKVIARPDLGSGIFIDRSHFKKTEVNNFVTSNCGADTSLYRVSAFEQFIHYIDASTRLENIPVIDDVLKNGYSKLDYNWNRGFYPKEELIGTTPVTASEPCKTVYSDPVNKKITIHNPKTEPGRWKKENVGIISRHGLCYGKIRVKAKLTELLNRNNMWNGLTNAIWMINQSDDGQWNLRRPCRKEGYMATYWGGENDKRVDRVGYSEIDFEILKTPPYCPDQYFPPLYRNPTNNPRDISSWNTRLPDEILNDDGNITVACTNWDMACWEPENFAAGCNPVSYGDRTFEAHRWNHTYRALTEKSPEPDDSLFGTKYYYFEIDWRPTEIIWRIGPEPDRMRVVGYMNDKVTSIPNNQMLLIVTQEFHNTKWWPGSPYQQDNIPFPANDIFGEILEVVIE